MKKNTYLIGLSHFQKCNLIYFAYLMVSYGNPAQKSYTSSHNTQWVEIN